MQVVFGYFVLHDSLEEASSADMMIFGLSAAALWILFAGRQILDADTHNLMVLGTVESTSWKVSIGFSRARWEFWSPRL